MTPHWYTLVVDALGPYYTTLAGADVPIPDLVGALQAEQDRAEREASRIFVPTPRAYVVPEPGADLRDAVEVAVPGRLLQSKSFKGKVRW